MDPLPPPKTGTAGCSGEPPGRVPIGSARCEDMSVRQCDRLYARGPKGWHYCEIDRHAVRTCSARAESGSRLKQSADSAQHWAIQQAFSPSSDWMVVERADHTVRAAESPAPDAKAVSELLEQQGKPPA